MAGLTDRPPTFLSARSADVILSEIRPTKLNSEAWRSINVLLDELLWLILSAARSFSTESIKSGLLKVLPTPLGKEALLEAEVELRAYWERTATSTPSRSYSESVHEFPLQPAYELMRLKCEAYSTLNDSDEDTDAEDRWQAKVTGSSGFSPHNVPYISPAALYLTAIIEAVCEHILSNIGRVTARDSSRTTASLQDLYIALCEDEAIYGLFKNMKVHEQIESQSKAFGRPRRSKSINRPSDHGRSASHALSASFSTTAGMDVGPAAPSKDRASSDSTASGTPNASGVALGPTGSRSSLEKARAKKLFGRGSAEKDGSQNSHGNIDNIGAHKRTESLLSNGRRSTTPFDDGQHSPTSTEVEFDELMRSGTTMKVSLTPDRLKSFEVYKQERGQRGAKSAPRSASSGAKSLHDAPVDTPVSVDAPSQASTNGYSTPVRAGVQHESILEDEEGGGSSSSSQQRQMKKSRGPPPVAYEEPPPGSQTNRNRSMSVSQSFSQGHQIVGRKSSLGAIGYIAPPPGSAGTQMSVNSRAPGSAHGSRGGMGSKVEPRDQDNSLEGTSDDDLPLIKKRAAVGFQPKEARGGTGATRDLISFLNEGPPEPPLPPPGLPLIEGGRKQGRFRSMVSRLKRGGSTEKLSQYTPAARNSSGTPPSFVPPPLSAKKSLISISTYVQSQGNSSQKTPTPISPPSSPSQTTHEEKETPPPVPPSLAGRSPVSPATRKAVPMLNGSAQQQQTQTQTQTQIQAQTQVQTQTQTETQTTRAEVKSEVKSGGDVILSASSTTTLTPSPRQDSLPRPPHSKQTARHALTPPASPASHIFASHVKDLRRLLAHASNADECRLLVDMFLAQSGFPLNASDYTEPSTNEALEQQQSSVVEALLSNSDTYSMSTKDSASTLSEANPPTPRSNSHSPTITTFRKQTHGADALPMTHVVTAEA